MTICSKVRARRWVYLVMLVLVIPVTGQAGAPGVHTTSQVEVEGVSRDASVTAHEMTNSGSAHCDDNRHLSTSSMDQHNPSTMTGHAGCDNSNHPCQCLSGACASPMAPVASISMPLLAPAVAHLSDLTFLPTVRRTGVRYRPPIQV